MMTAQLLFHQLRTGSWQGRSGNHSKNLRIYSHLFFVLCLQHFAADDVEEILRSSQIPANEISTSMIGAAKTYYARHLEIQADLTALHWSNLTALRAELRRIPNSVACKPEKVGAVAA